MTHESDFRVITKYNRIRKISRFLEMEIVSACVIQAVQYGIHRIYNTRKDWKLIRISTVLDGASADYVCDNMVDKINLVFV